MPKSSKHPTISSLTRITTMMNYKTPGNIINASLFTKPSL